MIFILSKTAKNRKQKSPNKHDTYGAFFMELS